MMDLPQWEWWSLRGCLHIAAFLLVTAHSLQTRREPTSTLLWMFIAFLFPIVGPLLYVAVGVYRVPRKGWRKHLRNQELLAHRRAREEAGLPLAYWRAVHSALATEPSTPFARELDRVMQVVLPDFPLLGGNRIRPLITGNQAYPAMLEAIRGAQHHVHFQTFMLCNDEVGEQFLEALAERARNGVRVRLLYDRFGSTHAVLGGLIRRFRGVANLQLVGWTQANPLKRQFQINLRNHRKIMVVDGRTAFVGGINVHRENIDTAAGPAIRDYHFEVTGPAVQELQYSFLRDWYFMTEEDPDVLLNQDLFPETAPAGDALVRLANSGPASEPEAFADIFFCCVTAARRQILAVTPYFVPPADIVRALRIAALRGVDVRLAAPQKNNHVYAGMAGRSLYSELLESGVRIFERPPPFMHAKALVVDDEVALVGTSNLDVRSLRLNYETNLAVFDSNFIEELKQIVLEEFAAAHEIELSAWRRRPALQKVAENFCFLLQPVL